MSETLIIIPSLNPDEKILTVVKTLKLKGFTNFLIINDGSEEENNHYFNSLKQDYGCEIITNKKNNGKGNALKQGFNRAIIMVNVESVITVDDDNQHKADDVLNVKKHLKIGHITLGSRIFTKDVPFKSYIGNKISSILFKYITKSNISDTQTGLRGMYIEDLKKIIEIDGERFDYEMNVILNLNRLSLNIVEVPIKTVYIENNETSHFKVITDTLKICSVIFKFLLSSLLCFCVDFTLFILLHYLILADNVFIPVLLSRMVSSFLNYKINYKVVFNSNKKSKTIMYKYYVLIFVIMILSSTLTTFFKGLGNIILVKMVVDSLLFIFNYNMQRKYIFKD